jgi:arginase
MTWSSTLRKTIALIAVPYDSGKAGERCGRAPLRALAAGIAERLQQRAEVSVTTIMHSGGYGTEGTLAFDVGRSLAQAVAAALKRGAFPLILGGDCLTSLGVTTGLALASEQRRAVLWLDAHPDYHTADTSTTGFLGGMPVAILVGDTYRAAAASLPSYRPIDRNDIVFLGARDIDTGEALRIERDKIPMFSGLDLRAGLQTALKAVAERSRRCPSVYLHLDLDVLDPDPVPASEYNCPDGIRFADLQILLTALADAAPLTAATLTAFDPSRDPAGIMMTRYLDLIDQIAGLGTR